MSDDEPASPAAIGLTREQYRRRPEVEAEIAALPAATDPAFLAAALAATAPETLVHAIRRALRAGRADLARALGEALASVAEPVIARVAARLTGLTRADLEDVAAAVAEQVWREVLDLTPAEEYWEVNFMTSATRACHDAAAPIWRRRDAEKSLVNGRDEDDAAVEALDPADPSIPPVEGRLVVAEAIGQLAGNVRRAFYLHYLGYKAASNDPAEVTISRLLGVSDRTVRTYLRQAEATLRAWWAAGGSGRSYSCS